MKKISKLIILFTILLFADNHHNNKDTKAVLNYFDSKITEAIISLKTKKPTKKVCIDYSKFNKLSKNDVNFAITYSLKNNEYRYLIEREKKLLYFLKEAIVYKKNHKLDYSHEMSILYSFSFTPFSWKTFVEDNKRYKKLPKKLRQYLDMIFKGENIDISFILKQSDMFNHNRKYEDVSRYCGYK